MHKRIYFTSSRLQADDQYRWASYAIHTMTRKVERRETSVIRNGIAWDREEDELYGSQHDQQESSAAHRHTSNTMPISRSEGSPTATEEPSNHPSGQRRVKDALKLYEQLAKQRNDGGASPIVENGHTTTNSSKSLVGGGNIKSANIRREDKDLFEIPLAKSHPIPDSPYKITSKDVPALKFMDHFSEIEEIPEIREIQEIQEEPIEDVKIEKTKGAAFSVGATYHRRSNSGSRLDAPSTGNEKSSPPRSRRHSQGLTKPSSSFEDSRTEKPEGGRLYTRSRTGISQEVDRRRSRGSTTSKKGNPPPPLPSSIAHSQTHTTKPSSSDSSADMESKLERAESKNTKVRSSSKVSSKGDFDQPSYSAMKSEDDSGHGYPLYTSQRVSGRRSKLDGSLELAGGTRQRSENPKQENGSHVPVTRKDSNKTLMQEGSMNHSHKYGRQGSPGDSVKEDSASVSGASKSEGGDPPFASKKLSETNQNVKVLLRGVAAARFNGGWLPFDGMVPSPKDIAELNQFLKDCSSEVEAGVPGRFLTVVLGKDTSDLDSVVSTIAYAYFLSCTGSEDQCFVPVLNMRHEELVLHPEAVWLFEVSGVDPSNLIFVDQISLQYFHRFGNLKVVLVDHSRLAPHQENLQEAVVEIVHHDSTDEAYPWVSTVDIQQVGSCCTMIAERFAAEAPEHLVGRGLSRLLLAPILVDTVNLDSKSSRCTTRDERMAAFLINGAGSYGQHGFFKLLRKMRYDISVLSTKDVLRKDFKQWKLGPGKTDTNGCKGRVLYAAMSTVGVPLMEVMKRRGILQELKSFEKKMKLDLHLVVTGYYDSNDRYKREILIVPDDPKLTEHLLACFSLHTEALKLSPINIEGLPDEMLVYRQGLVTASRRVVCQMLVDHFAK